MLSTFALDSSCIASTSPASCSALAFALGNDA
jgi:hypothetical protein